MAAAFLARRNKAVEDGGAMDELLHGDGVRSQTGLRMAAYRPLKHQSHRISISSRQHGVGRGHGGLARAPARFELRK